MLTFMVSLGGVKDRLKVWCCWSAYILSQVTDDKDPLVEPQAGLWHRQVHPLLGLYLARVVSAASTAQGPVTHFNMLGRLGRVLSVLCVSPSPVMRCCAVRGPLRCWDIHAGKPSATDEVQRW